MKAVLVYTIIIAGLIAAIVAVWQRPNTLLSRIGITGYLVGLFGFLIVTWRQG